MRLELARVQVPPRPGLRMIERRQLRATLRTRPPRRIVLQPQIDALLVRCQLHARHMPRRAEAQNRLKQFRILQRHSSLERLYQQDTSTSTCRRAGRPRSGAARADGLTHQPESLVTHGDSGRTKKSIPKRGHGSSPRTSCSDWHALTPSWLVVPAGFRGFPPSSAWPEARAGRYGRRAKVSYRLELVRSSQVTRRAFSRRL